MSVASKHYIHNRFIQCIAFGVFHYQLLFFTPGISPLLASSRKHILQISNFRIYPCFLPHFQHLLTILVENLGVFNDLACVDVLAILYNLLLYI